MEFMWKVVAVACLVFAEARGGDVDWVASIDPNEVRVPVGSDVMVRCTLLPAAPPGMTAHDIVWVYGDRELPQNHVTVLNNRTSVVTLHDLQPTERSSAGSPGGEPLMGGQTLMCLRRKAPGDEKHKLLRSADITVGWKPCPPSDYTCYMLDQTIVNCSWLPGECRGSHRSKYRLKYTVVNRLCNVSVPWENLARDNVKTADCLQTGGSGVYHCQFDQPRVSHANNYWMWVESSSDLGSSSSKMRCMHLWDIVKPSPPENVFFSVGQAPLFGLSLIWQPPAALPHNIYPMQYEVEFTASDTSSPRTEVVAVGNDMWYRIDGMEECSVYTARVRGHGYQREGFWSEWSSPVLHAVGELNPPGKGPDIWRVLADNETEDNREVTVLWEPLSCENGRCCVQEYILSINSSGRVSEIFVGNVSSYRLSLGPSQHRVTVAARNSIGRSKRNMLLVIPARSHQGPAPSQVSVRPDASRSLLVTWAVPVLSGRRLPPQGYLVEWANVSALDLGRIRWRRVSSINTSALLTDNFQDYVRYKVSVYASYQQGEGNCSSTYTYMKQGAPVVAPRNVLTHSCSASVCDVRWDPLGIDHLHGFLTHYAIYYRPSSGDGQAKRVLVPCTSPVEGTCISSHRLEGLEPNTEYELQVAAVTSAGEGPRSLTSKAVTGFREFVFIMMLIAGLLLLSGGIITCICIVIVPARMKHVFFHKVPDPKNCSWARDIDFSKPESLQGFLRITLSSSPDVRETETFSEITVDCGWKLQGHLLEKALDFDGGYTTTVPAHLPTSHGLGTKGGGETTKVIPEVPLPSRALPLPAKLLALEQLRASAASVASTRTQLPSWAQYSQHDAMSNIGGAPGPPGGMRLPASAPTHWGLETHVYENSDVKAAINPTQTSSGGGGGDGGGLARSLPTSAHPFSLQRNNNSNALPQGHPALDVDDSGGAGVMDGGVSSGGLEVPATVWTGRRETLLPCNVFSYQPQDPAYHLPLNGIYTNGLP